MAETPTGGGLSGATGADWAVRVVVPAASAEIVGAILMELLGPFQLVGFSEPETAGGEWFGGDRSGVAGGKSSETVTLVFYPGGEVAASLQALAATSPAELAAAVQAAIRATVPPELLGDEAEGLHVDIEEVPRDWVEGWREHFTPLVVGEVRIRPPWEPAVSDAVDVIINPGLGFGTGLHPTTRGVLRLLQEPAGADPAAARGAVTLEGSAAHDSVVEGPAAARRRAVTGGRAAVRGPLVDAGTGSGVLAIAAAKLGWGPVLAFDNDGVALVSARENLLANGVQDGVEILETDVARIPLSSLDGATMLANITLEPLLVLMRRLGTERIARTASNPPVPDSPVPDSPAPGSPITEASGPSRVIVSGVLAGEQESELVRVAGESGLEAGRCLYEDEWVSLELLPRRPIAPIGRIETEPRRAAPISGVQAGAPQSAPTSVAEVGPRHVASTAGAEAGSWPSDGPFEAEED